MLLTLAPSSATVPGQTVDHRATFPLGVSADGRHLADRSGRPFLVVGDTAWPLVAQLGENDVAHYLDDRAGRGFTAIMVNLIEHKFATNAPANRQGVQPFHITGGLPDEFKTKSVQLGMEPSTGGAVFQQVDRSSDLHIA